MVDKIPQIIDAAPRWGPVIWNALAGLGTYYATEFYDNNELNFLSAPHPPNKLSAQAPGGGGGAYPDPGGGGGGGGGGGSYHFRKVFNTYPYKMRLFTKFLQPWVEKWVKARIAYLLNKGYDWATADRLARAQAQSMSAASRTRRRRYKKKSTRRYKSRRSSYRRKYKKSRRYSF